MQTIAGFESILRRVGAIVFPTSCPTCGARGEPVCSACAASMRPAAPAPPPVGVTQWIAPFAYEHTARELIARVKYRNERHALGWLTRRACGEAELRVPRLCCEVRRGNAVVTWIPTTAEHRRQRGFDHAELIARAIARTFGSHAVQLLTRIDGHAQTGRSRSQRLRGPEFALLPSVRNPLMRNVIVCDDVATTGSTLRNAAGVLAQGLGVRDVSAITLARTPPRGTR